MSFPAGFFDRADADDVAFYQPSRLVTHIDAGVIAAVTALYDELALPAGDVLDLMSSWVSHQPRQPRSLSVLGMNADELAANPMATSRRVHDLNADPRLPYATASFDSVTCCVSIDYLTRPVEVLNEVARVLRPGGLVVVCFGNRCFPTKAIRGWLMTDDHQHGELITSYLELAGGFSPAEVSLRTPPESRTDPLWSVVSRRVDLG